MTPWFDPNALLWIGPIAGGLEAAWGGALGLLAYSIVRKGKGRAWVYGYAWAGALVALVLIGAGVIGGIEGQPLPIYVSLLGLGGPLLIAAVLSRIAFGKAYRLAELRRMQAQEM